MPNKYNYNIDPDISKSETLPSSFYKDPNVFEDINSNAVTGSMYLLDNFNIVTQAELQGNERLSFKLSTPGRQLAGFNHVFDSS